LEIRSKAVWLLIALAVLFGSLSLIFGFYFLLTSPSNSAVFLFGIIGIVFGILDFIAAFFYWKTGKLTWFILLFGPAIFIQAIPETWGSIFVIILLLTLLLVVAGLLFWITTKIPRKIMSRMPYVKCSKCGNLLMPDYQYCPYCGESTKSKD
jgi:hypothetical protein